MRSLSRSIALLQLALLPLLMSVVAGAESPAAKNSTTDAGNAKAAAKPGSGWDQAAAARYLDARQVWWQDWPHAQKDHGTMCVSCHTQVPYALARPILRKDLGESKISDPERAMLDSILKRVSLGSAATTFYTDAEHGPGKTQEARNAEAVNNALILVAYDAQANALQPATRKAFDAMWALQEQSGDKAGAWVWQNFHFSPWEAPESEYYGAAMAALAVGMAPDHYASDAAIQGNLKLLREYLKREEPDQPLINQIALLWASSNLPGLMTEPERTGLAANLAAKLATMQHADGGWSLTELGLNGKGVSSWKRHDATPFDERSDGFATGITVLALEVNGLGKSAEAGKGLAWILANQDKAQGLWPAWSVNVKRDPNSQVGKFMSDAATGFSVLALEKSQEPAVTAR